MRLPGMLVPLGITTMMIDQVGDRNMLTIGEDVECYILATDEPTVWPRPGPDKTTVAR